MSAGLQVVEQVALAFVQQIVIDGILFVDRDFFLQNASADAVSLHEDQNDRTGIDLEGEVDGIRFGDDRSGLAIETWARARFCF